jgi:hypothetical protein
LNNASFFKDLGYIINQPESRRSAAFIQIFNQHCILEQKSTLNDYFVVAVHALINKVAMTQSIQFGQTVAGHYAQRIELPTNLHRRGYFYSPPLLCDGMLPNSAAQAKAKYHMTNAGNVLKKFDEDGITHLYYIAENNLVMRQAVRVKGVPAGKEAFCEQVSSKESKLKPIEFSQKERIAVLLRNDVITLIPYHLVDTLNQRYHEKFPANFQGTEEEKIRKGYDILLDFVKEHAEEIKVYQQGEEMDMNTLYSADGVGLK